MRISFVDEYEKHPLEDVFSFAEESYEQVAFDVFKQTLSMEKCPYDCCVDLTFTDEEGIRALNKEYRQIDKETDVLSFPAIDYDTPADFSHVEKGLKDMYFDPETEELMLGDIVLCVPKVLAQAKEYGHSIKREYAFLIAHSMLHLLGYDHMTEEEATDMEKRQNLILKELGITREGDQKK